LTNRGPNEAPCCTPRFTNSSTSMKRHAVLDQLLDNGACGPTWIRAVAVILTLAPGIVSAQTQLRSYVVSHGSGVSSGEAVRIGVTLGLPMTGLAHNLEAATGVGFWYATRERLVIVATESDPPPDGIPDDFELQANYPNPFNPTTRIRYGVPQTSFVRIGVFNILGQLVSELVEEEKAAGYYDIDWNGRDRSGSQVPSGVYFYRLHAGRFTATRSMILQK